MSAYNNDENSLNIGLVLLAAGFGSRFGNDKQLHAVGPSDAIIMDYSIYDAWRIGYSWVTVILRSEIVEQFEREVGRRWRDRIELRYSIQDRTAHLGPEFQNLAEQRQKPWGTGHALLCAAAEVDGPFAVANADDFYGHHGFREIFHFLRTTVLKPRESPDLQQIPQAMVGYRLGHTLSENGPVARGICRTHFDEQGREWLNEIQEHTQLLRGEDLKIRSLGSGEPFVLGEETPVSMNLFGLQPSVFAHLEQQWQEFLRTLAASQSELLQKKKEFFLPAVIECMLERGQTTVAMLHSPEPWFGLTYPADVSNVCQNIAELTGRYPANLFADETLLL